MISVAQMRPSERAQFIQRTYTHLAGAVGVFIAVEFLLFQLGIAELLFKFVASSQLGWLAILGGFMVLGWFSRGLAAKADDIQAQYMGFGAYILGQALIFAPLLYLAAVFSDPSVIPTAAILTLFMFAGLTAIAFTTKTDFTFLGGILKIGGMVALGLIVCSILFGFQLGLLFSCVMVIFASAAILHDTSKVMKHYSINHHVAAALELFASVALLFWYILQILLSARR
jgi:FtsH-binding integral membrane protein